MLYPVVWRAGQDGGRAIELLAKHHSGQHMWPNHFAERQRRVGLSAKVRMNPIRPADQEGRVLSPRIAPLGQ